MKKVKNTDSKNESVAQASKPNAKPKNKVKKVNVAVKKVTHEEPKLPKPTENGGTETQAEKEKIIGKPSDADATKIDKKKAKRQAQQLKKKENKAKGDGDNNEAKKEANAASTKDKKQKNNKGKGAGAGAKTEDGKGVVAPVSPAKEPKLIERKKQRAEKKLKQKEERKQFDKSAERDPDVTAATVFVGNLPVNTKRVQLVKLFEAYAPVNAVRFRTAGGKVIFKHKHRTEAGSLNAYVVLKDAETAKRALALNGTEFKSNHLRVTQADMNSQNRGEGDAKRMIFVGNLKYSATEEKLREIFSSCGDIEYVRCLRDGDKGCKGVSYVTFKAPEAVGLALELNETMLDERPIHVERYSVKKLGAKQARDASGEADKKKSPKTGAKKRLDDKNKGHKKQGAEVAGEFRGVKVGGIQKKPVNKKKKQTSQMQQLAKKIAPKAV